VDFDSLIFLVSPPPEARSFLPDLFPHRCFDLRREPVRCLVSILSFVSRSTGPTASHLDSGLALVFVTVHSSALIVFPTQNFGIRLCVNWCRVTAGLILESPDQKTRGSVVQIALTR
jgi:hypothetical protein